MKKILIIATLGLQYEGITSVILNYASHMNRTGLELCFISTCKVEAGRKSEFEVLGKVIEVPNRKKQPLSYIKKISSIMKLGFDVIHVHGNSSTMIIELALAKKFKIPVRIAHGHNSMCSHPFIHKLLRPLMCQWATNMIACSQRAGDFLCGKKPYTVLYNAIDPCKYQFNSLVRNEIRKKHGLDEFFVLGHIGSFLKSKNHDFLIDIFRSVKDKGLNVKLLLVGDGPLKEQVENTAAQKKVDKDIIFLGQTKKAWLYYQAMDLFVMPSKWEGLPMVLIEAQSAGLPVIVSDQVTKEAKVSDEMTYFSLDEGADSWAEYIIHNYINKSRCVRREEICLVNGVFDIRAEADRLRKIYSGTNTSNLHIGI